RAFRGKVASLGAIAAQQPLLCHPLGVLQFQIADAVAAQEEQPPVAGSDGFRERHTDPLRIAVRLLPVKQQFGASALELFLGEGRLPDGFDGIDQAPERLRGFHVGLQLVTEQYHDWTELNEAEAEVSGSYGLG